MHQNHIIEQGMGTHKSIRKNYVNMIDGFSVQIQPYKHIIKEVKSNQNRSIREDWHSKCSQLPQILSKSIASTRIVIRTSSSRESLKHIDLIKSKRTLSDNTYGNVRLMRNRIANLWGAEKKKKKKIRRCRERFNKDAKLMISLSLSLRPAF